MASLFVRRQQVSAYPSWLTNTWKSYFCEVWNNGNGLVIVLFCILIFWYILTFGSWLSFFPFNGCMLWAQDSTNAYILAYLLAYALVAAASRNSWKFFLEIPQNSQENTCSRVSFFNKVAGLEQLFYWTPPGDYSSRFKEFRRTDVYRPFVFEWVLC